MLRFIATLTLVFVTASSLALVARPALRAAIVAEWNDPATLPALQSDPRIHHEPAARACAEQIADLLPIAMAQIETVHGRPFAKPPLIGVYASYPTYARANGLGDAGIAGVTRAGRALLSPTLCDNERERLASVLTHELSHVHFFGWRPRKASRPPPWFTEGLAVAASGGGGAEGVNDDDARRALRAGLRVILDDGAWTDFAAIRFEREPDCAAPCDLWTFRQRLAFRQAALFVDWLRTQKPEAFQRLLRDLEHGLDFDSAFTGSFDTGWKNHWRRFIDQ
jgi:hypothetical protein